MSDITAVLLWLLASLAWGWLGFLFAQRFLGQLADKGYSLSKTLGLLLSGYVLWLLGVFGLLKLDGGGIAFTVLLVAGLGIILQLRQPATARAWQWVREHWQYVVTVEVLFAVIFIGLAYIRALNPEIASTEKPMEFAFLNAILRGETLPPLDPWLSGYSISYYYFGYLLMAMLIKATGVLASVGFNLALALVFSLAALNAFGVLFNLIQAVRTVNKKVLEPYLMCKQSLGAALLAPMLLLGTGNLNGFFEWLYIQGFGAAQSVWGALWPFLNIKNIDSPPVAASTWRFWWWWQSSRVVRDIALSGGDIEVIDEFPFFSFLLGDLHPHVLALPFVILCVGIAMQVFLWARSTPFMVVEGQADAAKPDLRRQLNTWFDDILQISPPLWFLLLVFGALGFLNTWDFPVYVFVLMAAYCVGRSSQVGWQNRIFVQTALLGLVTLVGGICLYFPFYLNFKSQANGILPNPIFSTRPAQFFVMFGTLLVPIVILLLWQAVQKFNKLDWRTGLTGSLSVLAGLALVCIGISILAAAAIGKYAPEVGRILGGIAPDQAAGTILARRLWSAPGVAPFLAVLLTLVGSLLLSARQPADSARRPAWAVLLAAVLLVGTLFLPEVGQLQSLAATYNTGLLLMLGVLLAVATIALVSYRLFVRPNEIANTAPDVVTPFVLVLVLTGALLTLVPEFVYLWDQFGSRMNTVFKFYYQAWALWAIAAGFAVWYVLHHARRLGRIVIGVVCGAVCLAGLFYPVFALQAKTENWQGTIMRDGKRVATLDGLAHWNENEDWLAVQWLNQHLDVSGVITEAVGGSYTQFARISMSTGLATVLGWPGHEGQWRGGYLEVGSREADIKRLYETPTWQEALPILQQYHVNYVYLGELERSGLSTPAAEKFYDNLVPIYCSGRLQDPLKVCDGSEPVIIYQWKGIGQ